jgi:hypothetical protein
MRNNSIIDLQSKPDLARIIRLAIDRYESEPICIPGRTILVPPVLKPKTVRLKIFREGVCSEFDTHPVVHARALDNRNIFVEIGKSPETSVGPWAVIEG